MLSFRAPGDVALTPAQRATAWLFLVMAALFLIQSLVGAASQHYRADLGDFFGFDLAQVFLYNLTRTFHVQLAIFFVSASYLAAGIFLAPMIARREPKGQGRLAYILLGAVALVVLGCGLWLVGLEDVGYGTGWVDAALALFVAATLLGGLGGQRPKQARKLATRLARDGREVSPELRALLDDPIARAANYASAALIVAILALMVFKP